ncbi:hypothetical protein [Brazilian marseillevirus]|uniref:hypothetical protein n=1 Tax=Brazilian marseillevirus TaxID=1813599 RepID=UPI000785D664|nr:hypothetical protein A3303_gp409 [Brazilian marseillevirus]AMQ10917.1 hypothetical protein [Brazilian marseillevirus]
MVKMQDITKEANKFVEDVQKEIDTEWYFYNATTPSDKNSFLITSSLEQNFVDIKLQKNGDVLAWFWKEKKNKDYVPTQREVCLKRVAKDIMNSQSYQLLMVRKQLEKMNSNFEKLVELLSNGIEYSPNNPEKVQELEQHFSGLSEKQKE